MSCHPSSNTHPPSDHPSKQTAAEMPAAESGGVVAVILPKPTWSVELVESFEESCRKLTGDIDVIKVRKSLNKDEDAFIQAFVNHCLGKIDKFIQGFLVVESKRIEDLMKDLRDVMTLQLRIYKKEKAALEKNLVLGATGITFDFYVYESDLRDLKEMNMLKNLGKSSSAIKDISVREIHGYIMRIAQRAQMELESGLKEYIAQCKIPMSLKMKKLEPLGELREYRRTFFLSSIPDASEGDWEKKGRTKEAYNEDLSKSYSFKQLRYNSKGDLCSWGEVPTSRSELRQSTAKISVDLNIASTLLPFVKNVLDNILLKDE